MFRSLAVAVLCLVVAAPAWAAPFANPVAAATDPSVLRVGRDYYLVGSSFQYAPGLPLLHSRDLVNWSLVGNVLTRPAQLPIAGMKSSEGIWAANIREHGGVYYVITSAVQFKGPWRPRCFYVTARDPRGPWSDPIYVDEGGTDPDLFFDDDGKSYFLRNGAAGIHLGPIDLATGKLTGPMQHLWGGTGAPFPEGPHIYKRGGFYYLLIAEGGTGSFHRVTVARSKRLTWGYTPYEFNPILSHAARQAHPFQSLGHADLVHAHDGSWWAIFLGTRGIGADEARSQLGRETFLAPVAWTEDGWPTIGQAGMVDPIAEGPKFFSRQTAPRPIERDEFDSQTLAPQWQQLFVPEQGSSSSARRGFLRLIGGPVPLGDDGASTFVGQRQRDWDVTATTRLEFDPRTDGEEAGLAVYLDPAHHYEIAVARVDGVRRVQLRRQIGSLAAVVATRPLPAAGAVRLRVRATKAAYVFSWSPEGGAFDELGGGEAEYLVAREFTPAYFALYATGAGRPAKAPADFDWFELARKPR